MTTELPLNRRQLLKLVGVGIAAGTLGTGTASASDRGRYIVGIRSPAAARAVRGRAASVTRELDFGSLGRALAGVFSHEAVRALARRADVRYVEPDGYMHAIAIDASDAEVPWGVDRVDAEKIHLSSTGAGADVAIIDTGIDNDHPDLIGNLGEGISYTVGGRFSTATSTQPKDWDDGNGHGTHCAGTAAAVENEAGVVGVATAPTLHAVKVLTNSGSGSWSDVAAGIEYTAKQGWDVASLSLGGGYSQTVQDACTYAYQQGVLLVAASGNDGPGTADDHYPSASPEVIAVGATRSDDGLASFSSTGDTVELGAPGRDIYSTYKGGGYDTLSGTSMACPHVSGAGAILLAAGYTNVGARDQLRSTAEDVGLTTQEVGYGLLDVEKAVTGTSTDSGTTDTTPPAVPTLGEDGHTDSSVSLSWTKPADADLASFTLYRKLSTESTWVIENTYDATTTSTTVAGLSPETAYDFAVTATDTSGNESSKSNVVSVTTAPSTGSGSLAIASFTATSGNPNNPHAEIDMAWEVSGSPDSVTLELAGDTSRGAVSEIWPGLAASGTKSYEQKHTSGSYTVTLTATKGSETVQESRTLTA